MKDSIPVLGKTNDTLIYSNLIPDYSGDYYALVIGDCGIDSTNAFQLLVKDSSRIITVPEIYDVCKGDSVVIDFDNSGYNNNFQWYYSGKALMDSTTEQLRFRSIQDEHNGYYKLFVSGDCNSVMSDSVEVVVNENVNIVSQPEDMSFICSNPGDIQFILEATGRDLTYQWFKDGTLLSESSNYKGVNNDTLKIIDPACGTLIGNYSCMVSSFCGQVESEPAALNIDNTGTEDFSLKTKYSVFPNPFNDEIFVSGFDGTIGLRMYNTQGAIVRNIRSISADQKINVQDLIPGIYFVRISTSTKNYVFRIAKQ